MLRWRSLASHLASQNCRRSYVKDGRSFFKLRSHKINVPKNVKLEVIINDISLGAIQKNVTEDYKDVLQYVAFYRLPIKVGPEEDSILCIYGPTTYDTAPHTISLAQTLRTQVLKSDQFKKNNKDISEMDLCYRMRIIVHADYVKEIRSKKYNWEAYSRGKGVVQWHHYGTTFDKMFRKKSIPSIMTIYGNLEEVDNVFRRYLTTVDQIDKLNNKFKDITDEEVANQEYLDMARRNRLSIADVLVIGAALSYLGFSMYLINILY